MDQQCDQNKHLLKLQKYSLKWIIYYDSEQ